MSSPAPRPDSAVPAEPARAAGEPGPRRDHPLGRWARIAWACSAALHVLLLASGFVLLVLPALRSRAEHEGLGRQPAELLFAPPTEAPEAQEASHAEAPPELPPLPPPPDDLEEVDVPELPPEPLEPRPEVPAPPEPLVRTEPPLLPALPRPQAPAQPAPPAPAREVAPAPIPAPAPAAAPTPAPSAPAAPASRQGTRLVAVRAPRPELPAGYPLGPQGLVVWLQLYVDVSGAVRSVRVEQGSGDARLDESWRAFVEREWRFAPTDVARWVRLPVRAAPLPGVR